VNAERRRKCAGVTLIELLVAVSLSSIVLIGVFSMTASMVQYEVEGLRKGTVTGWSLASLVAMNREIEGASVLVYPAAGSGANYLVVCSNWSRILNNNAGGLLDATSTLTAYFYCYDAASAVLRRMTSTASCPASYAPPACNAGTFGASSMIATGVYPIGAAPVFAADSASTVNLRYTVGKPTAGVDVNEGNGATNLTNPQTMTFDTRITLDKAVGGANIQD
jgi:prepilin-type N-terminal cleavage/methylation domain-containing protein